MKTAQRTAWHQTTLAQALLGSLLAWAALPPVDWPALGWVATVPWLLLVRRPSLPGGWPYRALWLAGFAFWMGALHWLRLPYWATALGWFALSFYLACYLPAFVAITRVAVHRWRAPLWLAAPVVWTGLELVRAHLLTGFRMGSLSHSQYRWIELIQIADLGGAYAVDFLMLLVAACLALALPLEGRPGRWRPVVLAVGAVGLALTYGTWRSSGKPAPDAAVIGRVALIQGSIDTEMKEDLSKIVVVFEHYRDLSEKALRRYGKVDLIVWPETMYRDPLVVADADAVPPPGFDYTPEKFQKALASAAGNSVKLLGETARNLGVPALLGVETQHYTADGLRRYNSAVLLSADGRIEDRYDKMHPVMFGEYVPFSWAFPWLMRLVPIANVEAGQSPRAFDVGAMRLSPNICYETVVSHVVRRQINQLAAAGREPNVLVNLTNDGWFWGSSELDLHLMCGVFLAVECRKPMLIAANTGYSAWIDAAGRIRRQGPCHAPDTLLAEVQLGPGGSFYLRVGEWFAGLCLTLTVLLVLTEGYSRWRLRRAARGGAETR